MDINPFNDAKPDDDAESDVPVFKPLGEYEWPSAPAQETARRFLLRLRKTFAREEEEEPAMNKERLKRATLRKLDDVVAPPASGPLVRELDKTLKGWIAEPSPPSWLRLIVLPPCDENAVVETWGRENGHHILPPPGRAALTNGLGQVPSLEGRGVLVIPELEQWFMRHRNGLGLVRALLAKVERLERHCVIGCNSWAWAFLSKTANADAILPAGLTFQAFDADRLRKWFKELEEEDATEDVAFRLSGTGEDVLETDDKGELKSDFFEKLASRSYGIPWVAWYLWRTGLRSEQAPETSDDDAEEAAQGDGLTLWIVPFEEFTLPPGREQVSLLILQALLLHGPLTKDELFQVLPASSDLSILPALARAHFIARDGGRLKCRPAAYPAIRSELSGAGYSMDQL